MANNFRKGSPVVFDPRKQLPDDDVHVMVLCRHFRCLGYLHKGTWRQVYGDEEMTDVVGWTA